MPTNGWLNPKLEKQLRDQLAALPDLAALAATIIVPERAGRTAGGRSIPGSRPPISLATVDLTKPRTSGLVVGDPIGEADLAYRIGSRKQAIPDTLEAWVWLAHDEMLQDHQTPATPSSTLTVTEACAWLQRHIVWTLEQQWVLELAIDLRMMTRECKTILRERPDYQPRCPRTGCGGRLQDEGSGLWRCQTCDHTAGDHARLGLREVIARQKPMTAEQIGAAFGIKPGTIRKWKERGHLTPAQDGPRPTYHVVDILRLADDRGVS